MIEFYPQILMVHITAVTLSGGIFAIRGLASMAGLGQAMSAPVRYLSYTIDTVLLAAALMLVVILPKEVFASHWLMVKLALVVLYIIFGVLALRQGRSVRARAMCYGAALLVFIMIIGIASTHNPLGWLA